MFQTIGNIIGTVIAVPLTVITTLIKIVLLPIIKLIGAAFEFIGQVISAIGEAIDTYLIQPIEKAIDMLSNLNPLNWKSNALIALVKSAVGLAGKDEPQPDPEDDKPRPVVIKKLRE